MQLPRVSKWQEGIDRYIQMNETVAGSLERYEQKQKDTERDSRHRGRP